MAIKATSQVTLSLAEKGQKGDDGVSITSVTPQYYYSTSNTTTTGGEWSDNPSTTNDQDKYLWQRYKYTYSNNTTGYSNAFYESIITGVMSEVNKLSNSITNKVWESDITNAISSYDNETVTSIRDAVSEHTQTISGLQDSVSINTMAIADKADGTTVITLSENLSTLSQTVSGINTRVSANERSISEKADGSAVTDLTNRVSEVEQTADKISWLVSSDSSSSSVEMTDAAITAITNKFTVKSPDGTSVVIEDGLLKTDAIKSSNYVDEDTTTPYSDAGTFIDLANGDIRSTNFSVDAATGKVYVKGHVDITSGSIATQLLVGSANEDWGAAATGYSAFENLLVTNRLLIGKFDMAGSYGESEVLITNPNIYIRYSDDEVRFVDDAEPIRITRDTIKIGDAKDGLDGGRLLQDIYIAGYDMRDFLGRVGRYCFVGSDSSGTKGWYHFADIEIKNNYEDFNATFLITRTYPGNGSFNGMLYCNCRYETSGNASVYSLGWIAKSSDGLAYNYVGAVSSGRKVSLYVYLPTTQWGRIRIDIVSASTRYSDGSDRITLDSSGAPVSEPSFTKRSVDSYALSMMPVGYIYQSTSSTSPANIFGGTWTQLTNRFLVGAGNTYSSKSTGGSGSHTHTNPTTRAYSGTTGSTALTVAQMPQHQHITNARVQWFDSAGSNTLALSYSTNSSSNMRVDGGTTYTGHTGSGQGHTHSIPSHTHSVGDTGSSSNVPPYYGVYMWERTA